MCWSRGDSSFTVDVAVPSRNRYLSILGFGGKRTDLAGRLLLLRWRLLVDWDVGLGLRLSGRWCLRRCRTALLRDWPLRYHTRAQSRPLLLRLLLLLGLGSGGKLLHSHRGLALSGSAKRHLGWRLRSGLLGSTLERTHK